MGGRLVLTITGDTYKEKVPVHVTISGNNKTFDFTGSGTWGDLPYGSFEMGRFEANAWVPYGYEAKIDVATKKEVDIPTCTITVTVTKKEEPYYRSIDIGGK